jgi:hypothetical protein
MLGLTEGTLAAEPDWGRAGLWGRTDMQSPPTRRGLGSGGE